MSMDRKQCGRKRGKEKYLVISFLVFFLCIFLHAPINAHAGSTGYREFLNDRNKPSADYSKDDRDVFRIIEVIPHDACSIFPYMVDWKTEEEYNKNVPIGYEGLFYISSSNSGIQGSFFEGENSLPTRPYRIIAEGVKRDVLSSYPNVFTTVNTKAGGYWWREDVKDNNVTTNNIRTKDGYFEYVGAGKGLYYINTQYVAGESGSTNGIRYELQALPRTGKELGKGEYDVQDAKYYWAVDSVTASYPSAGGQGIESRTDFNYDIVFRYEEAEPGGAYRVYAVRGKTDTAPTTGMAYDYFARIIGEDNGGFTFESSKSGNYKKEGSNFVYVGAGKGGYVIKTEDISKIEKWSEEKAIAFEYAGQNKGLFDVAFIYTEESSGTTGSGGSEESGSVPLYSPEISKVSNKQGRYALTSTSAQLELGVKKPKYMKKTNGDYDQIITSIDCSGVDYTDMSNADGSNNYFATSSPFNAGVRMGRSRYDVNNEIGGWVFHETSVSSEEEYTKLNSIKDKTSFPVATRIYVRNQSRVYRYYCRHSFANNEWFKLLCYMDNPDDPSKPYSDNSNGAGFDSNISSGKNIIKAEKILASFDKTYRIEILQRTPGALTKNEVENADLIYVSDTAGIESMTEGWPRISNYLEDSGLPPLAPLEGVSHSAGYRFKDDFSNEVLMAIYNRCIYKREAALMTSVSLSASYMKSNQSEAELNLGKLVFFMDLMEDATDFTYFIAGNPWAVDKFNLIHPGGDGTLKIEVWPRHKGTNKYNSYEDMYNVKREGESSLYQTWHINYFEVPKESSVEVSWKGSEYTGNSSKGKVKEDETKYYSDWYTVARFNIGELNKIWRIIHNRLNTGKIVVDITNARMTYGDEKKKVIYGDEFITESFDIKYKIGVKGVMLETAPPLDDTIIYLDENDNDIYDAGEDYLPNGHQQYNTEDDNHKKNVRSFFEDDSSTTTPKLLSPDKEMKKVVVQAQDINGKIGYAVVWVVVREGFDLN